MKPSEGKRMDSAMLPSRFSRRPAGGAGLADPNGPRSRARPWSAVALLLGARQRGSELGVGGAAEGRSGVSALDCYSPAPATRVRPRRSCSACLLWLGSRPSGRSSTAVDCLQCSATAAGRWGGVLVPRAPDAGGHMGPSDPSCNTDQGV